MDLFRLFFEESSDALIAVNLNDGRLHSVNKSFTALTGHSRDEIQGESINILNSIFPEHHSHDRKLDWELIKNPGFYNDIAISTRDGNLRYLSVKVKHADFNGRSLALCILSDDTERQLLIRDLATKHYSLETAYMELEKMHQELKNTQEKMFQASKLVALGELAAGVSHELNQPLTGVRGFAQEIQECLKEKDSASIEKLAKEIITQADKMASLLAHLRSFAREEKKSLSASPLKAVALSDVFSRVSPLFQRQLQSKEILLDFKSPETPAKVAAEEHPLEQVLINLIANARDAILDRKATKTELRGRIEVSLEEDKDFWCMRVRDNGGGISEGIRDRIFNPFFTTKDPNKGMGLGLSLSYSIVHRYGGEISLEDSGENGTCFLIKLPKYAPKAKSRKAA
jgi:PAS domain S-box-containing protein